MKHNVSAFQQASHAHCGAHPPRPPMLRTSGANHDSRLNHSASAAEFERSLRALDFYTWPGVFFFDSADPLDIMARIDELIAAPDALRRALQTALGFMADAVATRRTLVAAALQRARDAVARADPADAIHLDGLVLPMTPCRERPANATMEGCPTEWLLPRGRGAKAID